MKNPEVHPIARWRARMGWSQQKLADMLGKSLSAIARLERSDKWTPYETWLALAALEHNAPTPPEFAQERGQ